MTPAAPGFTLQLGFFDGPLDLLLQMIERRELDVTTVSLAQVADLYLSYVHSLESVDPYDLAEFIAVAAKLLLIKSTALLPRPPSQAAADDVEDPTDLTERLLEYQQVKLAAQALREREALGLRSYARLAPLAPPSPRPKPEMGLPTDLMRALERLAREAMRQLPLETVQREQFTIADRIDLLRRRTAIGGTVSFRELLTARSRGEAIATFLAVLELLRLGELEARQDERFADIVLSRA